MGFIVAFYDHQAIDPQIVGRKFSTLAKAAADGFAVPEAVAISTRAHAYYLATGVWPDGLQEEVRAAARGLDFRRGVSIRSSATREDSANQSFAGQYQSFLDVDTENQLFARIEECWASASSEAVRSYLQAIHVQGTDAETPLLAVIIQKMVNSRIAGVAFSRNPVYPTREEMVIEAVQGHAEGLVSGRLTPCRAIVADNGVVNVDGGSRRRLRLARETPWLAVAGLLEKLVAAYAGAALDIEWAVDHNGSLWLLQVRPITALAPQDSLPPAGSWTRKIADDLWADRLTPFMAGLMLSNASRFDLSRIARMVGIAPVQPSLAVIKGYLYVNCESIRRTIAYVPRSLRFAQLGALLPSAMALSDIPAPRFWELARIGLRLCRLPLREPAMIPYRCLTTTPRMIQRLRSRMALSRAENRTSDQEILEKLQIDCQTLGLIQENNQWPYFHATLLTWVLRWLATDRLKYSGAAFLQLISRKGGNVTLYIEQWFRTMALKIGADPILAGRFREETPERVAASLPPPVRQDIDSFIARFGCRSRHRTLLMKRWVEAPEEVIAILQSLVRHPIGINTGAAEFQRSNVPAQPRNRLFSPALTILAGLARRFFDLREELRFLLDEVLFEIRKDLLELGRHFSLGDTILFLTLSEIENLVAGRFDCSTAEALAVRRRNQFLKPSDPCAFWVDGRPEFDFSSGGTQLHGIGTSPGMVTGRAIIVENPATAKIRSGDVVVARHTDPGWTPVLSLVGGIVMEEGGLLNHCSIVARELGIPAVVGVSRATQLIPEGSRVTIDGGAGMVRIESD